MAVYSRTEDRAAGMFSGRIWSAGIIAGLISGILMALAAMFYSMSMGLGFWLPMRNISALYYGVDALVLGGGAITAGVFTHLVVSALWGVGFAWMSRFVHALAPAIFFGILYATGIWAVMTFGILPAINTTMYDRVMVNPWWWFLLHWIYGAFLMFTPMLRRSIAHTERLEKEVQPMPKVA